ncbi:hypothetical protein [Yoonia sp. BS5-3]|uniref:HEAT repeat domain-containing protein n=1 Tax=Yoonia phaeophyticola TaxID=3137369 RepID=A0ABZ2V4E4_9RHOB
MRLFFVFFFAVLPLVAIAQQVRVQTGEHSSFTRVVVTLPLDTEWQLGRNDAGYLLRLSGVEGYDLARFFDLIPRTRIVDVSQGNRAGDLELDLGCLCYVDAFLDGERFLVMDFRNGVAPETAAFETSLEPQVLAPVEASLPSRTGPSISIGRRLLPVTFSQDEKVAEPLNEEFPAQQPTGTDDQPSDSAPRDEASGLSELEQSITRSLSRGLSLGVLEADLMTREGEEQALRFGDLPSPGLQTRSGIDLTAIPPDPVIATNQEGSTCLPDSYFDVRSWGDDRAFSEQLGDARMELAGEFDGMDETSVLALARLFVYFGFGREAIQTLALDGAQSKEREYLTAIARIVDDEYVRSNLFSGQVSCTSSVALWAMLASGRGPLDGQADAASIMRAFKDLPVGLQAHLGSKLSEQFLAIGDEDSALQVLRPASAAEVPTVDTQLAEMALKRSLGETDQAISDLANLARTEVTPETMLRLLDAIRSGDIEAQESDFLVADALRFENATIPEAEQLGEAQVRAYLAGDDFSAAQALIDELAAQIEEDMLDPLRNDFATAATARMSNAEFLQFALNETQRPTTEITKVDMAQRLLELGFPDQADELVSGAMVPDISTDLAKLKAEIALAKRDGNLALSYLDFAEVGVDDPLRIAALDILAGLPALANVVDDAQPEQQFWRRGEWAALTTSEDPLLRYASEAVLTETEPELSAARPLDSSRQLLDEAARSRAVVTELLDRFTSPADF